MPTIKGQVWVTNPLRLPRTKWFPRKGDFQCQTWDSPQQNGMFGYPASAQIRDSKKE